MVSPRPPSLTRREDINEIADIQHNHSNHYHSGQSQADGRKKTTDASYKTTNIRIRC